MSATEVMTEDIPLLCQSCQVRFKGMCGALNALQLGDLARYTHMARLDAGAELIAEETEIKTYANVVHGVVKLTKMLEDGRQQVVGLQFAPDFIGRLYGAHSTVAAEAASDVELCRIPKLALERLIKESPELEHRLLEQTLRELDDAREWMVTLGRKTAAEKVASFIYLIATHIDPKFDKLNDKNSAIEFEIPLTRMDIADFLGLTIETVSRQITKLRKESVIEVENNRRFIIPNLSVLAGRCG